MPDTLSLVATLHKNRMTSIHPWFFIIDIELGTNIVRLVNNNENIVWRGNTYVAFPFELSDLTVDGTGEIPTVSIKVSNLNGYIMKYIRESKGGEGATLTLRLVHQATLELGECYYEETFCVGRIPYDDRWITIKLDTEYVISQKVPPDRYMKDFCNYITGTGYGGIECGVSAAVMAQHPSCNGTLEDCRKRGNSKRWGGHPALPGGLRVG